MAGSHYGRCKATAQLSPEMKTPTTLILLLVAASNVFGLPGDIPAEDLAKIKAKFEADGHTAPTPSPDSNPHLDADGNPVDFEAVKTKLKNIGKEQGKKNMRSSLFSKSQGPWSKMGKNAYDKHKQRKSKEERAEGKARGEGPEPAPLKGFPADGTAEEQEAWADKKKKEVADARSKRNKQNGDWTASGHEDPYPINGTKADKDTWLAAAAESGRNGKGKSFWKRFKAASAGLGERIREQASKFADARGEGLGSNTENR